MNFADWIIAGILTVIVGLAVAYIIKKKKSGVKCIGCPDSGSCAAARGGYCNCNSSDTK